MINIVLIGDEVSDLEILKRMLSTIPFTNLTGAYSSSEESINHAVMDKPDILIAEISLSGINGLALAKDFLDILPDLKIILLYKDGKFAKEAFDIGAVGYMVKPLTREGLLRTLKKVANFERYLS